MTPKRAKTIFTVGAAVVLVFGLVAECDADTEPGGATPEEVFERMRTAATEEDYQEMAVCLSPQGRAQMSGMLVMVAGMTAAFSQMGAEMAGEMAETAPPTSSLEADLNALLARHGLDDSALGPPDASGGEIPEQFESPEFFADIMTFVQNLPDDGEGGSDQGPKKGFSVPAGGLTNLAVAGDSATAQVGEEPAKFVRVNGRWFIDPDLGLGSAAGNPES